MATMKSIFKMKIPRRYIHMVTAPKFSGNTYEADPLLSRLVQVIYTTWDKDFTDVAADLRRFGAQHNTLRKLSEECEMFPPSLKRIDGWGGKVNEVRTCEAWRQLHDIASKEGLVAIRHDNDEILREVHQAVKLLLFGGVSGMVSCPLAMTDGAATTLSNLLQSKGDSLDEQQLLRSTFSHLTTRNPSKFWTSGQWMTERRGGSDVTMATETRAVESHDDHVSPGKSIRLFGNKFYTSAIDCQTALTLARYNEDLALFLVHLPKEYDGSIEVEKLKNKLGTRQLPTAELTLNGIPATLLARRGIANIIPMLHITRLYNSIMAASYLRHITTLAVSFAETRRAFGGPIRELPLHRATLAKLECVTRGVTLQSVDMAMLLSNKETKHQLSSVIRTLSAVVKIHTALVAVRNIRDGLECFGGAGYMEDTGLPGIFRDACVLPVWEGTTDVLSAETARALGKEQALGETLTYIRELSRGSRNLGGYLATKTSNNTSFKSLEGVVDVYLDDLHTMATEGHDKPGRDRTVAECIGAAHTAACLINFARISNDSSDKAVANVWTHLFLPRIRAAPKKDIDDILQDQ